MEALFIEVVLERSETVAALLSSRFIPALAGPAFRFRTVLVLASSCSQATFLDVKSGDRESLWFRAPHVLLVDDDEGDVLLAKTALEKGAEVGAVHVAYDGRQALDFLRKAPPYSDAPRPDVVLLDLNMPRMSGQELLAEVKQDPALADIPVIILTTSSQDSDVARLYRLRANCYVTKPRTLDGLEEALEATKRFWLRVARLPPKPD